MSDERSANDPRFRRRDGCPSRWFRGSVLVADPSGAFHAVDGASALAWDGLDRPGTVDEVAARIGARWGRADLGDGGVAGGIALLLSAGLVEAVE